MPFISSRAVAAPEPVAASEPEPEISECPDCSAHVPAGEGQGLNNDLCESCSENYTECMACEASIHVDHVHYTDHDSGPYCRHCYDDVRMQELREEEEEEEEEEESGPIYGHDEDVMRHLGKLGNPADGLWYGIELECEVDYHLADAASCFADSLNGYAILKQDGSINSGFEVVTAPATLEIHRKCMAGRFLSHRDALRKYRMTSAKTDTCGMHVHVSRAPLSQLQIGKMQVFLHNPDNHAFVACIAQRSSGRWAGFTDAKKLTDLRAEDRYTALNLQNRATVELRIFRGNLRMDRVMKNLEFTAALVNWCATSVAGIAECADYRNFVKWVSKRDYPALYAYLQETGYLKAPVSKIVIKFDGKTTPMPIVTELQFEEM